jgi:acetyltransferase-like isoleucine patch superfamily enzyme
MLLKIVRTLRERPLFFFEYVRTVLLFQRTKCLIAIARLAGFFPSHIKIGPGTKVQRLRCLRLELPHARIAIGAHSIIYENAKIEAFGSGKIEIGECAVIGDTRITSRSQITIGKRFLSSWNVLIQDFDPHPTDPELRGRQVESMCGVGAPLENWTFPTNDIVIGDDVWAGANVSVLKGARIGSGCVLATGAVVVAGDWPARSVLAGSPAKVIKTIGEKI